MHLFFYNLEVLWKTCIKNLKNISILGLCFYFTEMLKVPTTRDGNGSGRVRIVYTRNSTRKKKIRPLPARLLIGYPLKKYPRISLKPAGIRGYSKPANI